MTQTAPFPTARRAGSKRRAIGFPIGAPVAGLSRETVPSKPFATQTLPAPTATSLGPSPTRIVLRAPVVGSRRSTVPLAASTIQTAPARAATATGSPPTLIVWTIVFVPGSICNTVPANSFAIQIDPSPAASPTGVAPVPRVVTTLCVRGSIHEGNVLIIVDLVAGTTTFDGKGRVDTVPGLGVVFHVSGRMMFDANGDLIFEAAPHDDLDNNLGDLCGYLAGP